jgi:hypothetical protein
MLKTALITLLMFSSAPIVRAQALPPVPARTPTPNASSFHRRVVVQRSLQLSSRNVRPVTLRFDPRYQIRRIRIERRAGSVGISHVDALYPDGRTMPIVYNTMVSRRFPTIDVDLPAGSTGVVIDTAPTRYGRGAGAGRVLTARVDVIGVR